MAEAGDFTLIVAQADPGAAAAPFARAFSLDDTLARQILSSAPIIFAEGLTKSDVKELTQKLGELSKAGLEFRVTARAVPGLPRVHWPNRPDFTSAGGESAEGLGFVWNNTAFVCPGCGETFLFQRSQPLRIEEGA